MGEPLRDWSRIFADESFITQGRWPHWALCTIVSSRKGGGEADADAAPFASTFAQSGGARDRAVEEATNTNYASVGMRDMRGVIWRSLGKNFFSHFYTSAVRYGTVRCERGGKDWVENDTDQGPGN